MSECHTGANVAELHRNVAAEWDISEKDAALVTDNAANMAVAAQLAGFLHIEYYSTPCFVAKTKVAGAACAQTGDRRSNTLE